MPELLTPGVFIQEVDFGPQPIEGVSTTTAGFVGEAERGLIEGPPKLVTSFEDFQRKFGGFLSGKTLAYAVQGFFENGGRRAYVSRVVGANNAIAEESFPSAGGTDFDVRILAVSGNTVSLSSVVGLETGAAQIELVSKATGTATAFQVNSVTGTTGVVTLNTTPTGVTPATHFARIPGNASLVTVLARDPGAFGNEIAVLVDARYANSTTIQAKISDTSWVLASTEFVSIGDKIQFEMANGSDRRVATVSSVNAATRTIGTTETTTDDYTGGRLFLVVWRVTVTFRGAVVETFDSLPARVSSGIAQAFADEINQRSEWIRIQVVPSGTPEPDLDPAVARKFPTFVFGAAEVLAGGANGDPVDENEVIGESLPPRSGLKALEAQDGISIIAAPGYVKTEVVNELIGQAERRMDRFAVFDAGVQGSDAAATGPLEDVNDVLNQRGLYNSRYGAMYHPWVSVRDPLTQTSIPLPPSGHVLGAYARTDVDRGVFKAPANVVLRGVSGFSSDVTTGEQDILNPAGVNVLRRFDGLGNVIWGARTISAEGLWKYVPVRRLFIFLEQSIVRGTRFAVFEPNDLRLWARLRDAVTNFLTTQWRAGALFGARPEEAFFVKVDETTTTQDDRDNGRVNIIVGIAPVKPAEFIVFQIGQAPQSVIIAEQT